MTPITLAERDWKPAVKQQIQELLPGEDATHAVIWFPEDHDAEPQLLDICEGHTEATISAEDRAAKLTGEVRVVSISDFDDVDAPDDDDQAAVDAKTDTGLTFEADPDKGQLFKVSVDNSQPNVCKIAFSGSVELSRGEAEEAGFFNKLKEGKQATLKVGAFVSGSKKTHRRDSDGNVDSVVQTKTVIVTDVHLGDA